MYHPPSCWLMVQWGYNVSMLMLSTTSSMEYIHHLVSFSQIASLLAIWSIQHGARLKVTLGIVTGIYWFIGIKGYANASLLLPRSYCSFVVLFYTV